MPSNTVGLSKSKSLSFVCVFWRLILQAGHFLLPSPVVSRVRVEGPRSVPFLAEQPGYPGLEPHSGLQVLDVSSTFSVQGTFREAPGAARVEDCQLCRPGAFCGRTGLTEPQGLCSPGHHCGPGSNTSSPVSAGPPGPKGGKAGLSSEAWAGVRGHQYLPLGLTASWGNRAKNGGTLQRQSQ